MHHSGKLLINVILNIPSATLSGPHSKWNLLIHQLKVQGKENEKDVSSAKNVNNNSAKNFVLEDKDNKTFYNNGNKCSSIQIKRLLVNGYRQKDSGVFGSALLKADKTLSCKELFFLQVRVETTTIHGKSIRLVTYPVIWNGA